MGNPAVDAVTELAAQSSIQQMKPQTVKTSKRKQGSNNPNAPWSRAQARWIDQFLVRVGIISPTNHPDNLLDQFKDADGNIPECFHPENLSKIDVNCIAWWDET